MGIDSLSQRIANVGHKSIQIVTANPVGTAVGAAAVGAVAGGLITGLAVSASKKRKRSKNRSFRKRSRGIKHTRRGWKQDRARRSKQKWEVAYQRRKRKGKRRGKIYYAKKTGQPYIILASGKAKFIKGKRRK
jgi:ribulose kinase